MVRYDFNCLKHGEFEAEVPMGTQETSCPVEGCGRLAGKVFSPPRGKESVLITAGFRDGYTDPEGDVL